VLLSSEVLDCSECEVMFSAVLNTGLQCCPSRTQQSPSGLLLVVIKQIKRRKELSVWCLFSKVRTKLLSIPKYNEGLCNFSDPMNIAHEAIPICKIVKKYQTSIFRWPQLTGIISKLIFRYLLLSAKRDIG